ncbi:uncharacterized protein [Primulina eburnea]|uniref:uncharacterized protein n=1 Tax=Primulina eburnea TaxID=1245227 RepID=UPI003C6C7807
MIHTTFKELMTTFMQDGDLAHEHGLHMTGLIENVVGLEYAIPNELLDDINLLSFTSSFDGVMVKFNLNKIDDSFEELFNMLMTYEFTIKQENGVFLMASRQDKKWPTR